MKETPFDASVNWDSVAGTVGESKFASFRGECSDRFGELEPHIKGFEIPFIPIRFHPMCYENEGLSDAQGQVCQKCKQPNPQHIQTIQHIL